IKNDFKGTLARIAEIGYADIEFWEYTKGGFFNVPAGEIKKILDDLGMKCSSIHIGIKDLSTDTTQVFETAKILESNYVSCNYLETYERESLDDYKKHAALFNRLGEKAETLGMQFGYHNHEFEFEEMEGQVPYDLLLNECDEELVKFEMDMYWMHVAKQDPVAYFQTHPHRFPLWHIKDANAQGQFTPVGQGVIDWERIFNHADVAGLEQYFVEQDNHPNGKPFENIAESLAYLKEQKF
ncbi:MAG: sugar phosphate isomerase/epimerase, partial [Fulvivirga sp.]|nr:sugar phosphate isomerase/epimerase [Fulvivirga sp.]